MTVNSVGIVCFLMILLSTFSRMYADYYQMNPTLAFISLKQKAYASVFVYDISVTCHVNPNADSAQAFTKLF